MAFRAKERTVAHLMLQDGLGNESRFVIAHPDKGTDHLILNNQNLRGYANLGNPTRDWPLNAEIRVTYVGNDREFARIEATGNTLAYFQQKRLRKGIAGSLELNKLAWLTLGANQIRLSLLGFTTRS